MKRNLIIISTTLLACSFFNAQASNTLTGCAAKKQSIEREIEYAEMHDNHYRVAGLKSALQETNDHCTESGLLEKRQNKVEKKKLKVLERERDLESAKIDGRQSKIDKKMRKLEEARSELREAQATLAE